MWKANVPTKDAPVGSIVCDDCPIAPRILVVIQLPDEVKRFLPTPDEQAIPEPAIAS